MSDARPAPDAPAALELRDVTFSYPSEGGFLPPVLEGASCVVPEGSFCLLVGATGSGKTTALRLAKPELRPAGRLCGSVSVFGQDAAGLDVGESARLVGYVFQSPDNQIVCDSVWHELSFGLESLGTGQDEMRRRVSEVCVFLGIEAWFRRRLSELSGGQRQIVALAAVLAMRPRMLLLDEPTAMLDPVASHQFLSLLFRVNRELGTTVVVATHDPSEVREYAERAYGLEGGALREVSLRDLDASSDLGTPAPVPMTPEIELLDDAWLRYGRGDPWVLRGCDLRVRAGELRALLGGNGSGKSTLLATVAGALRPQRGRVRSVLRKSQALLPQQPKELLCRESVYDELMEWAAVKGYGQAEVEAALERLGLDGCRDLHPFDLSGGQQQLLALEKLLLTQPRLLLLDEPTKGLDMPARLALAGRLRELAAAGTSVIVATHDTAFVRAVAHTVSLLFDGQAGEPEDADRFFGRSWMWRP